jgi:hypothetical protein
MHRAPRCAVRRELFPGALPFPGVLPFPGGPRHPGLCRVPAMALLAGMRRLYQATLVMFWLAVGLPGMGVK